MKYKYNEISCYYKTGESLILIPKGELLSMGGGVDIEPVFEIKPPFVKDELGQKINECFSYCWSKKINEIPKGPSIIEQYLNIKGYKKIVEKYDFCLLRYDKIEKVYYLMKSGKDKNFRGYSGMEIVEMGSSINIEYIIQMLLK